MKFFLNPLLTTSHALCLCCQYHKQEKSGYCVACYRDLPHLVRPCTYCGLMCNEDNVCVCHPEDWPFIACLSAFDYQFPINKLISQYKNQGRLSLCQSFAESIATQIRQQKHLLPELLLPVPLSTKKLAQRGFNQSVELAKQLSQILAIPVDYHLLQTTGQAKSQKQLSKQQRLHLDSAQYYLTKPLTHQHIAIIDDVITTGATVKTIASLLRKQGATQLQAWSIARVNSTKE